MIQREPRPASPSDYVKAPVQTRSTKTLEKIIAASMELFDEKGFKHASMMEIASRAGVSVATLYTRFKDKETLLDYLFSDLQATRLEAARAHFESDRWNGIAIGGRVGHLIGQLVQGAEEHTGLFRALSHRQLLEERTPVEIECEEQVSEMLAAWLQRGAGEDGRELAGQPARMAVSLIASAVRMQVVFGITCGLTREEFIDQLSAAMRCYIDDACSQPADERDGIDG